MSFFGGLGGLNPSPNGVTIGVIQLQLPSDINTRASVLAQTEKICKMVTKARSNLSSMDLIVFPEYSLHGLSMETSDDVTCKMDGEEVSMMRRACEREKIWACFSIMEYNPIGNPYNTGFIVDDKGVIVLYYRKMHPWIPVEPWEPGNIGIPVCDGPKGCKLALIICHDGMFPEMARECAYKGAEIMIRTAGYTAPIREAWRFTNQANSFQNLMITANVCMCGSDGQFDSMGEGMIVNFDGGIIAHGTTSRQDEIITAEVRPDLVREARKHWGVENNIYQLGHRGYVAVKGGAKDCPYSYMKDLVNGVYRLPWEDEIVHKDGRSCNFPAPTREYFPNIFPAPTREFVVGSLDNPQIKVKKPKNELIPKEFRCTRTHGKNRCLKARLEGSSFCGLHGKEVSYTPGGVSVTPGGVSVTPGGGN